MFVVVVDGRRAVVVVDGWMSMVVVDRRRPVQHHPGDRPGG